MKMIRAEFMTSEQKQKMGDKTRTHFDCYEATGVCRPGKTAHDRATGAWKSHAARRAAKIAYQESLSTNSKRK
jgi:hypothetical protein